MRERDREEELTHAGTGGGGERKRERKSPHARGGGGGERKPTHVGKRERERERAHECRRERGSESPWLLFLYVFFSPLGLPYANWA